MLHRPNGDCPHCKKIINRYPGFDPLLAKWFFALQARHPTLHTSCAGRDRIEQEAAFFRGASRAHFGQSAHNYNAALDLFFIVDGKAVWGLTEARTCFDIVLVPNLPDWITWGATWRHFPEMAHVELARWKYLVSEGQLKLVSD